MADISNVILHSFSEKDLAIWLGCRGARVIEYKGHYWMAKPFGFFHAIHPLARLSAAAATLPASLCWGFRTTLCEADAHLANSTLPVHFLDDVANYDTQALSPRRRSQIRSCLKNVEITVIDTPDLLLSQGYSVHVSAYQRNGYGKIPGLKQYKDHIMKFFAKRGGLVLGGFVDGRLGGYLAGYAVGSTAYIESVTLATEYLGTNISSCLFFDWVQICMRSECIVQVVHGLHTPENPGLCRHKDSLGLSVFHVPALTWFLPPMNRVVKLLRPHAYYRLTGNLAQAV